MGQKGDWVANCRPDRVGRIKAASIFILREGPPRPNQQHSLEDLQSQGVVGLYRAGRKNDEIAHADQEAYLHQSDFLPSPEVLRSFLGRVSEKSST